MAVHGLCNLLQHLYAMSNTGKKSVSIMTTVSGRDRKADALKKVLPKEKGRGVKVRIVVIKAKASKNAQVLSKLAQVRYSADLPARFCVVDNKQVTFMVLDDEVAHPNYDFGVWVNADNFAKSFGRIFDIFWSK